MTKFEEHLKSVHKKGWAEIQAHIDKLDEEIEARFVRNYWKNLKKLQQMGRNIQARRKKYRGRNQGEIDRLIRIGKYNKKHRWLPHSMRKWLECWQTHEGIKDYYTELVFFSNVIESGRHFSSSARPSARDEGNILTATRTKIVNNPYRY